MYLYIASVPDFKTMTNFVSLFVFKLIIILAFVAHFTSLDTFHRIPVSCLKSIATISMLDPRHYRLPVKTFRITTHTVGLVFESDTRSANHVSIYLLMGDLSSVRLNMTKAGPTDTEGTYTEDYYPYEMSHSTVHFNDLRAVGGLTVGDVTQLVGSKGRKKYTLAPSGVGCRFWV